MTAKVRGRPAGSKPDRVSGRGVSRGTSSVSAKAVGLATTVRVALLVVALPAPLVNTTRKKLPLWESVALKVRFVLVAPGMSLNVAPPLALTCHCTVGVGAPEADAVKVTELPSPTVWFAGWPVITGGATTVLFTVEELFPVMGSEVEEVTAAVFVTVAPPRTPAFT